MLSSFWMVENVNAFSIFYAADTSSIGNCAGMRNFFFCSVTRIAMRDNRMFFPHYSFSFFKRFLIEKFLGVAAHCYQGANFFPPNNPPPFFF